MLLAKKHNFNWFILNRSDKKHAKNSKKTLLAIKMKLTPVNQNEIFYN